MGLLPALHEVEMLTDQHSLIALVHNLDLLGHDPAIYALWVVALVGDAGRDPDRIRGGDRPDEAQPVLAVRHRPRVDLAGGYADRHAEDQGAVRDALPKVLGLAPFGVHVVR